MLLGANEVSFSRIFIHGSQQFTCTNYYTELLELLPNSRRIYNRMPQENIWND